MDKEKSWTDEMADQARLDFSTDQAFAHLVTTHQTGVRFLVNTRDTRRLQLLQACTNETYRRADECMRLGKKMQIDTSSTQQADDN